MALGLIAGATNANADTDVGATASTETVSGSLVLKVQHPELLEAYVASTQTPISFTYHQWLSVNEFATLFAPSQRDINTIKSYLAANGITVTEVYADRLLLKVTGPASAFDAVFSADLHDFQDAQGHRHHRPRHQPSTPRALNDLLTAVVGLDSSSGNFRPHNVHAQEATHPLALPSGTSTATGQPGNFTVGDVANQYNVNPLYNHHIDGRGRTIGIATLAGFDPQDAYTYWDAIGLTYKANRITQVHVDGGGAISSVAGSGETALDVEQSGGMAPQANIIVYDTPNTDVGFMDVFYKLASDNKVDTMSLSWGEAEEYYYEQVVGVDNTPQLVAFHQAFLEMAAQGISAFTSSGDAGAYEINRFDPGFSKSLTIGAPASDPAITTAGGTTLPGDQDYGFPEVLTIAQEQVWGWDYLSDFFAEFGVDILSEVFPAGGGGGVSIFWPRPYYQQNLAGVRNTEAGQTISYDYGDGNGPIDYFDMPAHFAGRNTPDLSANADPETGLVYYSVEDGGFGNFTGGTSFVAPQFNGITALLAQSNGGRLGFLNPMLYRFARHHSNAIVDITAGDDWFYDGIAGYDPGAGLGVPNVANLDQAIKNDRFSWF
ncbi:MAG: S53 family serine peptidase [Kofleriaceae bacterium]